jgi:hypothetical protein
MQSTIRYLFFLLTLFLSSALWAGKTRSIDKLFFVNGNVRALIITETIIPWHSDFYSYYKETRVFRTEFDSLTGRRVKETVRYTKLGRGGRHCYEILYKETRYDLAGNKTHFEKQKCDKYKSKTIEYTGGKKTSVIIHKPRRRLWF